MDAVSVSSPHVYLCSCSSHLIGPHSLINGHRVPCDKGGSLCTEPPPASAMSTDRSTRPMGALTMRRAFRCLPGSHVPVNRGQRLLPVVSLSPSPAHGVAGWRGSAGRG